MEDSSNDSEKETAESMSEWYKELGITNPFFADDNVCIVHGDCRNVLSSAPKCGSAIVTDPPYELSFMGKSWDSKGVSFRKDTWEIIRSACLSGAPLLSFGGSRTQHRIACAIEDAGWEIRDTLMWVYGSGFPKSLDIGKTIDKASRGVPQGSSDPTSLHHGRYTTQASVGKRHDGDKGQQYGSGSKWMVDRAGWVSSDRELVTEAQLWNGYGTALKPAYEPIILAMNPMDKTFAHNALKYGVAGLNIDGCRVEYQSDYDKSQATPQGICTSKEISAIGAEPDVGRGLDRIGFNRPEQKGRFPANFLHDGSDEVMELFPHSKGSGRARVLKRSAKPEQVGWGMNKHFPDGVELPDAGDGSTARFFYCAKASKSERGAANNHPTVKPLALMEYLCKLVKMPEYNLIIDPFMGSGTTLLACARLGIPCIGIDSDEQSCEIATIRYLRSQAE